MSVGVGVWVWWAREGGWLAEGTHDAEAHVYTHRNDREVAAHGSKWQHLVDLEGGGPKRGGGALD